MVQKEKEEFIKKIQNYTGLKIWDRIDCKFIYNWNEVFMSAKNSRPVLEPLFNYYQQDLQK